MNVEPPTISELARRIEKVESKSVHDVVYERDMNEIRVDIKEIRDGQRWAMRLIAGQFLTMVIALLLWVITSWPP